MKCACVYVDFTSDVLPRNRITKEVDAVSNNCCCECKEIIKTGERYRKETVEWDNGCKTKNNTCYGCISIRDTFFCDGWYYEMIFECLKEHINEMGGEISEDCLIQLTPKARDKVCKIIEDYWEWRE